MHRPRRLIYTAVLTVIFLIAVSGLALAADVSDDTWSDISDATWQDIYQVSAADAFTIAAGYPDGSFRPAQAVTRGQFAKMVVTGFGLSTRAPLTPTFSDVPLGDTYFSWIETGCAAGLIGGYDDGTFRPAVSTSRQQANSILGLYLCQNELSLAGRIQGDSATYDTLGAWYAAEGATVLAPFADRTSIAPVHAPVTAYLVHRGVAEGGARAGGLYLNPEANLTRAQAVTMILRTKAAAAAQPQVIQVGAILPLDGPWSAIGQSADVALDLALSTLNDYLLKDGLQVELVVENSSSDPTKALTALETLHVKGVQTVIGPMTSAEAAAIVDYADANDMMIVSPSSTAASLALPDNLFRLVPNDTNQVAALFNLMKSRGITRILPVFLDDEYGRDFAQGLRTQAGDPKIGIQVLAPVSYDPTVTDFAPVVGAITAAAAGLDPATTAIVLVGRDSDAVGIFSGAGVTSPLANFKWLSTDGIIREASILANTKAAAFAAKVRLEGFTFACEATAPIVPTMLVAGLMSAELGEAPSTSAVPIWDALWFIGEAYRLAPEADTAALMENFTSVVNNGGNFFGQMTKLDVNGDMIPVRYARFAAEEADGEPRWNLKGMFVKSLSMGTLIVDATSNLTRETGDAVIGAVLPLTGVNAEHGSGALKAIDLAVEHANFYFTITEGLGIHFAVEVRDTGSDPATALVQVKALHDLGIDLIIGPENSGELAAIEAYAKANGIVILSTTSTAPSLAKSDDRIMRLTANDTRQAKALSRLVTAQEKDHVVLIYRDDPYGQGFATALAKVFEGGIDGFSYGPSETDFSTVLDSAAARIEELDAADDVAVLVVGLKETTQVLEQVEAGPLTSVDWYGADGISKSRELLASPRAVAVAEQTHLTCSAYDMAGLRNFVPFDHVLNSYLTPLLGGPQSWNEISAYDALWLGASAFAMTGPHADAEELWNTLKGLYGTVGMGGSYSFDVNGDRTLSTYAFYTVRETATGPAWEAIAFYRDFFAAPDDLYIIGDGLSPVARVH
jgi:branched-chain amino acid transport system substrate-binding protein